MRKEIKTIATGSIHMFSEGYEKPIPEPPKKVIKLKIKTKNDQEKNK